MIFCPTLEHKNDLKSLLSSSGNKMLQKNKTFQLLRNSCIVEGVLWLVKIILFFYLIDFFSSKLLFLTKSSFKMSTASVPRLLSRDFPSSNFWGSGISWIAVSISSIIFLSGFTATAVGELNNDDFEGGNNSGD